METNHSGGRVGCCHKSRYVCTLLTKNESIRIPVTPRVTHTHTHTHTPPQGEARITKVRTNVHARAAKTKNEDMKTERTRQDKSVRDCDERGTKCTGTTDEPHLIVKTWAT